jgi:hypothetical protein
MMSLLAGESSEIEDSGRHKIKWVSVQHKPRLFVSAFDPLC